MNKVFFLLLQAWIWMAVGFASVCSLALESAAQSISQQPSPTIKAPGLIVSFEGSTSDNSIALVLELLIKKANLVELSVALPTEQRIVRSGDSVCKMLREIGYPQPCGEVILRVVDRLNSSWSLDKTLLVGQTLVLPAPQLVKYSVTRPFSGGDAQLKSVLKAGASQNARLFDVRAGEPRVSYDAYRLFIPTVGDAESRELQKAIGALPRLVDVKVDLVLLYPELALQQSNPTKTSDEWKEICESGELFLNTYLYRDMAPGDRDALAHSGLAGTPTPVWVHIVDGPINEAPSLDPINTKVHSKCRWVRFDLAQHHATHMAGIIASKDNGNGFLGLAPHAYVDPFELIKVVNGKAVPASDGWQVSLAERMARSSNAPLPLQVYLIASDITQRGVGGLSGERFGDLISSRIKDSYSLFVVAAGHAASGKRPISLNAHVDMFPQSFGDLRNVIVVTACDPCSQVDAQLMPTANFSSSGGVHVAAPGGSSIPAWVTLEGVASAQGTSQAAAYVAGIAASMVGMYKDAYPHGEQVKRRLQVTSKPVRWSSTDNKKLTAGVVDPVVALLDPTKHWLKRNGGWQAVRIRSISDDPQVHSIQVSTNSPKSIPATSLLRFVRTTGGATSERQWDIYSEPHKAFPEESPAAEMLRIRNLKPVGSPIVLCNGARLKWEEIEDLIVSIGGVDARACR